jgi:hypothetical protein
VSLWMENEAGYSERGEKIDGLVKCGNGQNGVVSLSRLRMKAVSGVEPKSARQDAIYRNVVND